jgi:O-methyltransferase involved in polyketide biosynthesis
MYLSAEAVDNTLDFIRSSSARGSMVIFDYIYASVLRRENRFYGEKGGFETVSRVGEGWTFGVEEGEIEQFLAKRGFNLIDRYTASDLEQRYFTAGDIAPSRRINGTHCIVTASAAY